MNQHDGRNGRRAWIASLVLLWMGLANPPALAGPVTDCPLAHRPYSSSTILSDLLSNPQAKAILLRDMPGAPTNKQLPPGFANIISPRWMLAQNPKSGDLTDRLDRDLATVPVTREAIVARCARYDNVRPKLPSNIRRPAILVFDKITGFRDMPSVNAASAALNAMAIRRHWTLVFSDRAAVFNARDLARFDAVVWNNVSGDALTIPQQNALKRWLSRGGGFAAFHGSGGDPVYVWDWYADSLIGARFIGHPMNPQFQAARVIVADPRAGITSGLPSQWTMTEEWYSFAASPRSKGAHILASLDETTYSPKGFGGQNLRMGDHPIAWTQCIGNGRSFYSAIGHRPESYNEPNSVRLLEQGIAWAAGFGATQCNQGSESAIATGSRLDAGDQHRPSGAIAIKVAGEAPMTVYVPATLDHKHAPPLVLLLHGSTGDGSSALAMSGLARVAERHGFVVAAPNGGMIAGNGYAWNVPGVPTVTGKLPGKGDRDDVHYLLKAIDALVRRGLADPTRIYVTGISGGGRMASWLGCVAPNRIAAIAPVVGLRAGRPSTQEPSQPEIRSCQPRRAVPVLAFAGDEDTTNPIAGGGARYWGYSMHAAEARWASINHCHGTLPTKWIDTLVYEEGYTDCRDGADVVARITKGGGHRWLADNEAMWAFFDQHRRRR